MFIAADGDVTSVKNSYARERFSPFDPRDLETPGLQADIIRWFLAHPQWWLAIVRNVCPNVRFKKDWVLISRFDDVQEVLGLDDVFPVPFGDKVKLLDDGPNFLLGMQDGEEYRRIQKDIMDIFAIKHIATIVTPEAARLSRNIVSASGGRLDAVEGLITLVATRVCESYFGVPVPEETAFGQWTIAMSTFMFADPTNNPAYRRCAVAAGERLRALIDDAIAAERRASSPRNTLARLLARQAGNPYLTDAIVRSYLIGMITGFVPTNTMAAGHILQVLFKRKDMFAAARAAALANDDERLRRCLFEAMRFMPLNLGPFRVCARDYTVAAGSRRARTLKKGDNLLVSTQSAMFDERRVDRPWDFDPDRPAFHSMLFGYGLHWCTGAFIAAAQITQTMKALLVQPNLRPAQGDAGRMHFLGPFPQHLTVEFGS